MALIRMKINTRRRFEFLNNDSIFPNVEKLWSYDIYQYHYQSTLNGICVNSIDFAALLSLSLKLIGEKERNNYLVGF